jgi:GTP cyclohydrolase I
MAHIGTTTQAVGSTLAELRFPVEDALAGYRALLLHRGLDPDSESLSETPERAFRAFIEMTAGYEIDPVGLLARTFAVEHSDEMVLVRGIDFTSLCEHHLLPFTGTAHVGYLPSHRVVGLSKIPRVVDAYAKRLQVQERLTLQIATTILDTLGALGCGVVITARHGCMCHRGICKPGADMVTSAMLGRFRENGPARAEFLSLIST